MPPVLKVGSGSARGEEELVDRAARQVDEEAEAEDAEDDGRDAGEVVDGDAHGAHERPLPRVLPQVEGRDDAERHDGGAHEDHHHDRAEDRREDAALGVGLPRLARHELPEPREVDAELPEEAEAVGPEEPHDRRDRDRLLLAVGVGERDLCPSRSRRSARRPAREALRSSSAGPRSPPRARRPSATVAFARPSRGPRMSRRFVLELEVDLADLSLLEPPDRAGAGCARPSSATRSIAKRAGSDPPTAACPPAATLSRKPWNGPYSCRSTRTASGGTRARRDLGLRDPAEVEAIEVAVGQAHLDALARATRRPSPRGSSRARAPRRRTSSRP